MSTQSQIIKEAKLFEFYARRIWPIHRIFAKRYLSQRCNRCSLSAKASPLNASGLCTYCTSGQVELVSKERQKEMEIQFELLLSKSIGKRQYDILVLFSGGKDSSFLIHKLKSDYPQLRLLALTIDNSFMSPVALENISFFIKKLNVDHVIYKPKSRLYENAFRYALLHLDGEGTSERVDFLDGELLLDAARHIAAQRSIPTIICGYSYEQVSRFLGPGVWHTDRSFEILKRITAGAYNISDLSTEKDQSYWWDGTSYKEEHIANVVFPLVVWNLSEEYIKNQVVQLQLVDKKRSSPLVTNNQLIPLLGLVDMATLGYSSWETEFTKMIRKGKADRLFWRNVFELLEYSAKTGHFISKSVDEVLDRLRLTREDVGIKEK